MTTLKSIHQKLSHFGLSLATAESCTGGWIAKLITDQSGSSMYFRGGLVVYSVESKKKFLGLKVKTMSQCVTRKVASDMAKKTKQKFLTDFAISTTGYMEWNPQVSQSKLWRDAQKKSAKKVTGLCFIGLATASGLTQCKQLVLTGNRKQNRLSTSRTALNMLAQEIDRTLLRSKTK